MSFRSGRLRKEIEEEAAEYTSSLTFDSEILRAVILVNAVHVKSLYKLGYLKRSGVERALAVFKRMYEEGLELSDYRLEDIHMVVEEALRKEVPEVAGNLALAKSRNDAVATAIRLRIKERMVELMSKALELVTVLLNVAEKEAETIFPVYTHMQVAAPATYGFVISSFASRVISSLSSLRDAFHNVDKSPLGAVAVAGSSIEVDRKWEAEQLGFSSVLENALDATASRDFLVDVLSPLLKLALQLVDLAEEVVVYSISGLDLIEVPDEMASTSSVMPQKKNPVVAEIARTKVAEVVAELVRGVTIVSRKFSGYNLDLQQATPSLWRSFDELTKTLSVMGKLVEGIRVRRKRAYEACMPPAGIVELANYLVKVHGLSFRQAHELCGKISTFIYEGKLNDENLASLLEESRLRLELNVEQLLKLLEPTRVVKGYATLGSSNPSEVRRMVSEMRKTCEELEGWLRSVKRSLNEIEQRVFTLE